MDIHSTPPYAFMARIGPIAPLKKKRSRTTTIDQDCLYFVPGAVGQIGNTNMTKGYGMAAK